VKNLIWLDESKKLISKLASLNHRFVATLLIQIGAGILLS
jgi:hypothetical protein